jgi:Flp pilus assembly protein TadG
MRWLIRRGRRGDSGAAAIFIAIVVVIVVVPLAAIVADAGNIYSERRQQQNGADAAALGVIQGCVKATCDTGTGATSTAGSLANLNANDAKTTVDRVCGTWSGLSACPAPTGQRWDCGAATGTAKYAQVYTSVKTSTGATALPTWFSRAIFGPSATGAHVKACARAAAGTPGGLTSQLPLTISLCEWLRYVGNTQPGNYAPAPPYTFPTPGYPVTYDHVIYFHNTNGATHCPAGPSGADLPGGYGWLHTTNGCQATSTDGWVNDSPGVPPPNSCQVAMMQAMQGQVVFIPVFDNTNGLTGNNGQYHIAGYAAFFLAGYNITGQYKAKDVATNQFPCNGSNTCISGWFTQALTNGIPSGGGQNYGAYVIGLTG